MKELQLTVVTPEGKCGPFRCDSIRLTVSDDLDGQGGGSYGIRPGHVSTLISIDAGPLTATLNGSAVLGASCGSGFATVESNAVTVVTDSYSEK